MVVLPKETDLPKMNKEAVTKQEEKQEETTLPLQDILVAFEQRILNLEAALYRIKGAI